MKYFRASRYLERYEDVSFEVEHPLAINSNDGSEQERKIMRIGQNINSTY